MTSRARPLSMWSTRSRKSRVVEQLDIEEMTQNPEDFAWKRKYRQSLNDIDLATQFAAYMSPDVSKSFLEHNKEEFETVLEARPDRRSTMCSNAPVSPFADVQAESSWRDLDLTNVQRYARRSTLLSVSPTYSSIEEERTSRDLASNPREAHLASAMEQLTMGTNTDSKPSGRRHKLLRPMRSFVNLLRPTKRP